MSGSGSGFIAALSENQSGPERTSSEATCTIPSPGSSFPVGSVVVLAPGQAEETARSIKPGGIVSGTHTRKVVPVSLAATSHARCGWPPSSRARRGEDGLGEALGAQKLDLRLGRGPGDRDCSCRIPQPASHRDTDAAARKQEAPRLPPERKQCQRDTHRRENRRPGIVTDYEFSSQRLWSRPEDTCPSRWTLPEAGSLGVSADGRRARRSASHARAPAFGPLLSASESRLAGWFAQPAPRRPTKAGASQYAPPVQWWRLSRSRSLRRRAKHQLRTTRTVTSMTAWRQHLGASTRQLDMWWPVGLALILHVPFVLGLLNSQRPPWLDTAWLVSGTLVGLGVALVVFLLQAASAQSLSSQATFSAVVANTWIVWPTALALTFLVSIGVLERFGATSGSPPAWANTWAFAAFVCQIVAFRHRICEDAQGCLASWRGTDTQSDRTRFNGSCGRRLIPATPYDCRPSPIVGRSRLLRNICAGPANTRREGGTASRYRPQTATATR
jgi:hypothetical protein